MYIAEMNLHLFLRTKEKPVIEVKEIKEKGKDKVKEKENTVQEPPPPVDGGGEDEAMPVPQVTIGPDGNIVINEQRYIDAQIFS